MQSKDTFENIDEDIVKIQEFETRFMRIRYEHLISMPHETIQTVLNFCSLSMMPQILTALSGVRYQIQDHYDTSGLSKETLDILNSLAYKYGFLDAKEYLQSMGLSAVLILP